MTSPARLGPVSTPAGLEGQTWPTTSVMRSIVSCSSPLARLRIGVPSTIAGTALDSTSRKPCDGTPITTTLAPSSASAIDEVARSDSGSKASPR